MELTLNDYQTEARETAVYPERYRILYPAMGLAREAGEALEKVKKAARKSGETDRIEAHLDIDGLVAELGDVLWYVASVAHDLGYSMEHVARLNLDKLRSRAVRGTIVGEGDKR
jgi:NTP pyrophosphatase (non-canonical NTP hydrolase)